VILELLDQPWGILLLVLGLAFTLVDMVVPESFSPGPDEKKEKQDSQRKMSK